jgi:hypothetical protein
MTPLTTIVTDLRIPSSGIPLDLLIGVSLVMIIVIFGVVFLVRRQARKA